VKTSPEPDIVFDSVTYTYDGRHNVVDGLSLAVQRGEYIAILGGNGSGKSTVAKLMNALFIPDAGEVRIMGLSTSNPEETRAIRRQAGLVFQDPDDQMITSLVGDDVAFGPENLGLSPEQTRLRVADSLQVVGLDGFADRETYSLSGGQKQRVAIAGILAMAPDIIILDEPGAMLDPRGRRGIRRVSHELNAKGITVVLITHFMDEAVAADRVIVLDAGRAVLDGTPADVFIQHDRLASLHLEEPFSIQLTAALRQRGTYVPYGIEEDTLMEALCL
jgi:energy-coupling factor transporter ATPase